MKEHRIFSLFMIIAMLMTVSFAASAWPWEQSRLKMDYGTSFKLAKFGQVANPGAEKNLAPVTGLEGQVAEAVIGKYRKGFGVETSKSSNNMSSAGYGTLIPVLPESVTVPMGATAR